MNREIVSSLFLKIIVPVISVRMNYRRYGCAVTFIKLPQTQAITTYAVIVAHNRANAGS